MGTPIFPATTPSFRVRRTFQETDAPDQMLTRVKVAKAFSRPVMAQFEPVIRALCGPILDAALEKGTFDATKEIARLLPMRMLGHILDTPDEDLPWLVEKGDALIANTDPDFTQHVLDKMTTDEFRMMPFNSPAGAMLFVYGKELMRKKAEAGEVWDTMADDVIRWASPTSHFRRTATRDFDYHGKQVKAGDTVLYWFNSGNRDENAFAEPFRVDFARNPNRRVAFGQGGPHVCLGMWLARLEVRVLFEELARRIKSVEPARAHRFLRSNFIGGIKELPVHVTRH